MATTTNRLGLRKPDTTDYIDVTTDISENMQKIDDQFDPANANAHSHDGVNSKKVSHADLADLATGDPHPQYALDTDLATTNSNLSAHTGNTNNPHGVTAAQVGAIPNTAGSVTDTLIGNRTVNQGLAGATNTGPLTSLLSWIAGAIKAIKGTTNWYDAPATTLAAANAHMGNTSNPHNVTASQIGAANILNEIKTVDGAGSGLDADTVDGMHGTAFATVEQATVLGKRIATLPANLAGYPVRGSDGNLYVYTTAKAFYRVTPSGVVTALAAVPDGGGVLMRGATPGVLYMVWVTVNTGLITISKYTIATNTWSAVSSYDTINNLTPTSYAIAAVENPNNPEEFFIRVGWDVGTDWVHQLWVRSPANAWTSYYSTSVSSSLGISRGAVIGNGNVFIWGQSNNSFGYFLMAEKTGPSTANVGIAYGSVLFVYNGWMYGISDTTRGTFVGAHQTGNSTTNDDMFLLAASLPASFVPEISPLSNSVYFYSNQNGVGSNYVYSTGSLPLR